MGAHLFISDDKGNIRFTREGREYLQPIFELAGIEINEICTMKEYKLARKQVTPYFMQHLDNRAYAWPDTDQFKLLKAAVFCSAEGLEQEVRRFDFKKSLKIVT